MTTIRFTIIDARSTASFLAPPHALKALAAACSRGAETVRGALALLEDYDRQLAIRLREELAVCAEHATPDDPAWLHARLEAGGDPGAFTVFDEPSRRASLEGGPLGLVVFNLPARRIVQLQNSYANLERRDRGRVRRDGKPVATYYSYELPPEWSIVP